MNKPYRSISSGLKIRGFTNKSSSPENPEGRPGQPRRKPARKKTLPKRKNGAPPRAIRRGPESMDQTIQIDAPCTCPHCQKQTDLSNTDTTSFVQEDIVLRPQTVVTHYIHSTAWCPKCRRQVIRKPQNQLPFAPIGPNAKAAALYLRHELRLPYRKIQEAMSTLFGLDFVPASSLGFEKRARKNADPLYEDLVSKMRHCNLVHADETHWRQDGENYFLWYAGNEDVAVFHMDAHQSAEAAQVLLGERIEGLLVTDAYAAYNAIEVSGRQSCLAHLLRKADELRKELGTMKKPDLDSTRFCNRLIDLFKQACAKKLPWSKKAQTKLKNHFLRALDLICEKSLAFAKAETLRKRLIPGAREYTEVFTFIESKGPPTNNHAERALRLLVIFRKVCMGTRSDQGSENISVFSSLTQTAKLQNSSVLDLFSALITSSPQQAHGVIFDNST